MRVLGVDPGLTTTGYGVVERRAGKLRALAVGVIATAPTDAPGPRLVELREGLARVIQETTPDAASLERVFFNANVKTAIGVGQASGVLMVTMAEAGLDIQEYTPTEVKTSVVGFGAASKKQVQAMVTSLLGLDEPPSPPDAADACALAICHLNRSGLARAVAAATR